jgi:hypothetical protein
MHIRHVWTNPIAPLPSQSYGHLHHLFLVLSLPVQHHHNLLSPAAKFTFCPSIAPSCPPTHPTTHTESFPPPHDPQPVSQCNCSMLHSCLWQTKYLYHLIAHNLKDTRMQRTLAWVGGLWIDQENKEEEGQNLSYFYTDLCTVFNLTPQTKNQNMTLFPDPKNNIIPPHLPSQTTKHDRV